MESGIIPQTHKRYIERVMKDLKFGFVFLEHLRENNGVDKHKNIAKRLGIGKHTYSTHLSDLYDLKLIGPLEDASGVELTETGYAILDAGNKN